MAKKNKESTMSKFKNEVFNIIRTTLLDRSTKRVWFVKKGLC